MAHRFRGLAALAVAGGLAVGGVALAQGPLYKGSAILGQSSDFGGGFGGGFFKSPESAPPRLRARRAPRERASARIYGQPVCVRLCDGSFFPTDSATGGDAACAAQCPDAPTELYIMTSDKIDDAVSLSGAPYSKLPVANRYQTSFESTCTCHREVTASSRTEELLHDATLRRGDVVMTRQGFRVYVGGGYGPQGPDDFVALSQARGLPKAERAELVAMERAAAGSPARAAPPMTARRPKGKVTVDDGAPKPRR